MAIIKRDSKGKIQKATGENTNKNGTAGRPTHMTPEALVKLEQAFAIDATMAEACSYAEIGIDVYTYYREQHPEFAQRVKELRMRPVLKARQTVVNALNDPDYAFKYLERKRRKEFGNTLALGFGEDLEKPTLININLNGTLNQSISAPSPSVDLPDGQDDN